ncbi:MAG: hypothetical protein HY986_10890 [Candidatus Melainabacteria bacterium]|nr:hypothetical protein [Candidatus Melainabacteria bacterium]
MSKTTDEIRLPGWFSLIPALNELQIMVSLSGQFGRCFHESNEILIAELKLYGGHTGGLKAPTARPHSGNWMHDIIQEQVGILETFIYRNALMQRLVEALGGDTEGVKLETDFVLPADSLARLTGTMDAISRQMRIYNKLEARRLQALNKRLSQAQATPPQTELSD